MKTTRAVQSIFALTALACGDPSAGGPQGSGTLKLALTVPATGDAVCVEERATNLINGRSVVLVQELVPGSEQVIDFPDVPAGDVEVSAIATNAFADGECVGDTTYEAEPVQLTLRPGDTAELSQTFLSRAKLIIDGSFEEDIYAVGSECDNIALGASVTTAQIWGGGVYPADIVDGATSYTDTWAHGIAFTGGPSGWNGEACGWREVVLGWETPQLISSAMIWHHGDYHIPKTYTLEASLDGISWTTIEDTSSVRNDLRSDTETWGATPTQHDFEAVSASTIRYRMDNCDMLYPTADSHGWLYQFDVLACE